MYINWRSPRIYSESAKFGDEVHGFVEDMKRAQAQNNTARAHKESTENSNVFTIQRV